MRQLKLSLRLICFIFGAVLILFFIDVSLTLLSFFTSVFFQYFSVWVGIRKQLIEPIIFQIVETMIGISGILLYKRFAYEGKVNMFFNGFIMVLIMYPMFHLLSAWILNLFVQGCVIKYTFWETFVRFGFKLLIFTIGALIAIFGFRRLSKQGKYYILFTFILYMVLKLLLLYIKS
jgi:hypothetical protein